MNNYTLGTLVQLTANFTQTSNSAPIVPTTVTCKIKDPNGVVTDISNSISSPSTGEYVATYLPSMLGIFSYEFIGTGSAEAASIGTFNVNAQTF